MRNKKEYFMVIFTELGGASGRLFISVTDTKDCQRNTKRICNPPIAPFHSPTTISRDALGGKPQRQISPREQLTMPKVSFNEIADKPGYLRPGW